MAEKQPPEKRATKSAAPRATDGFTAEERAAMKERAQELMSEARLSARPKKVDGEQDVLSKIAELDEPDRAMAERIHAVVQAAAAKLAPNTWNGMPACAKEGKVVVFVQAAKKCGLRYATLGFSDQARLDDGNRWPSAYAVTAWTDEVERRVVELVKRAAG